MYVQGVNQSVLSFSDTHVVYTLPIKVCYALKAPMHVGAKAVNQSVYTCCMCGTWNVVVYKLYKLSSNCVTDTIFVYSCQSKCVP